MKDVLGILDDGKVPMEANGWSHEQGKMALGNRRNVLLVDGNDDVLLLEDVDLGSPFPNRRVDICDTENGV